MRGFCCIPLLLAAWILGCSGVITVSIIPQEQVVAAVKLTCEGKKETETSCHRKTRHLRSAIFWSAYSMDRTLTTILGRPLTLRDEAIDREFPGLDNNDEVESAATQWDQTTSQDQAVEQQPPGLAPTPYTACVYSLRFDRIVAEIKLMLYRVSRSPSRFPWPTNITAWQREAHNVCASLLQEARNQQQSSLSNGFGTLSGVTLQRLELKYHHCIMLLYRPSPQIPHPSTEAIQACFSSAMDIISIYADLHRFLNMECSWLSAHSILVAAITVLYCLCSHPAIRGITPVETCLKRTELAHELLSFLGRSWSVADEAGLKLGRLIAATSEVYSANATVGGSLADRQEYEDGGNMVTLQQSSSGTDNPDMPALDGRAFLTDELGVLRDLFDLGWLDESEFGNQPSFFGS